jgi:hypothetical protein
MTIKTFIASLAIIITTSLGAMLGTTTTANAGDFSFNIELGNSRHYVPRHHYYGERYYTGERILLPARKRHCSARRAIRKARNLGIRNPRIVRMNKRAIKVVGRARGYRTAIKFARNRQCSVLRIR